MSGQTEYKDTLNLPKTEFPMRGNLAKREPEMLAKWQEQDLYARIVEARKDGPKFILHDGPPYTSGHIHYGHILNKILKDLVVKFHTMKGESSPYVPGWDCHGLPIELQVERELGDKKASMSKVEIRRLCRDHALRFAQVQNEEFQRFGVFGDWKQPYLTLHKSYEAQVIRALAAFAKTGAIYRGKKPVHWCPTDATALAEAEIEHKDHTSPSIYVRMPLRDFDAATLDDKLKGKTVSLVIWTTTPWTLPANLAVVMQPRFTYVAIVSGKGDEVLLCAKDLAPSFLEACSIGSKPDQWIELAKDKLAVLEGVRYQHPFIEKPVAENDFKLWFADHVTLEQGTGLVHTAPGHGADDFHVGMDKKLAVYAPVDDHGRFTDEVPRWAGMKTHEANPKIIAFLAESGALLSDVKATVRHSFPHCWRCKNPVLFRATPQWFLSMDSGDLRARALDEIKNTRWIPEWGENRITGMIENRPDWCLSRQRTWGVPIPAIYCTDCGTERLDAELLEHVADLFEKDGADAWYERDVSELIVPGTTCKKCGKASFEKEDNIVDVWFESGTSWLAVCAKNPQLGEPVDLYLEGSDQHRGWFHSSLLVALGVVGHAPYKTVLTHGFVLDSSGVPYSKSSIEEAKRKGKKIDYIPPDDVLGKQGAEVLRLWVASTEFRNDINYSREILKQLSESYRKIRNTFRFLLGNVFDFDPKTETLVSSELADIDRYALARLGDLVARTRRAYDDYQFHTAFRAMLDYVTTDLSAFYLDVVKDRLYCEGADSPERHAAQTTVHAIARTLSLLSAPVLCFTAEELWQHLPHTPGDVDSVHLALMPEGAPLEKDDPLAVRWAVLLRYRELALKSLEPFRAEKHHPLEARVSITPLKADRMVLTENQDTLADLFGVSAALLSSEDANDEPVLTVDQAPGRKCPRCWKFTEDSRDLCDRCHRTIEDS